MPNTPPNLIASGNILPNRFVTLDTAEEHSGSQAGANAANIVGISREGTRHAPLSDLVTAATNYHAIDGEPIGLYGDGDICLLDAADASITAGLWLKSDADGKGTAVATTGTTIQYAGALALQASAAEDEKILVMVRQRVIRPALS